MRRITWLAALAATLAWPAQAAMQFKIATADAKGTYFAIGADLAKMVAPAADIELEVMPTDGSAANIKHLRYDQGVKFAIVQADVYQAFVERGAGGNARLQLGPALSWLRHDGCRPRAQARHRSPPVPLADGVLRRAAAGL